MADPLKLLQEYALGKLDVREINSNGVVYYAFGDVAYQGDAKTNFGVYNKPDEYYSVESIIYFWRNRDMQHTNYVKEVSGKGIQAITRMQRKELIDYLKGERPTLPTSMLAPISAPIPVSKLSSGQSEPDRKRPKLDQEKKGQRIDKILDQTIDKADTSEVRGLSNELPAEKVAQLRTLVKKNLKNKPIESEGLAFSDTQLVLDASGDSIGKILLEKERVRKDRFTRLESQSKDFLSILAMVNDMKTRESGKVPSSTQPQPNRFAPPQNQNNKRPPTNVGYSRYDQEIFQKDPIKEFEIKTDLSFHGTSIRQAMGNTSLLSQESTSGQTPNGQERANSSSEISVPQKRTSKRVSRTPIIIIPSSETALISMYNAKEILQDLTFIPTSEKKLLTKRENEILLQIRKNGSTVLYRVIDNPKKLTDEDWERVVAVFVQGPAWQFKGWKWDGNPVEIFAHIAAFHLKFDEQKPDPNVSKWSVNLLEVSRTKRHLDKAILNKFWTILEKHIAKNKPWLKF